MFEAQFKKSIYLSVFGWLCFSLFFLVTCQQSVDQLAWPEVSQENKPWTRWWWMGSSVDKSGLTAAMETYQKAGLGGLEITPIYGVKGFEDKFIPYLSPQWVEMLQHTLQEGQRLDLGIDMATGTGWPFGGPFVNADDASRYMAWKTFKLKSGEGLDELVIFTQQPLVRAVSGKVDISEIKEPISDNNNLQQLALDQVRFEKKLPLQAFMGFSERNDVFDVTYFVDKEGRAFGSAPLGNWDLYALFAGWHGKMVERAAPGGEGFVIDHFSAKAVRNYLAHFDKALEGSDINYLRSFFNDSYEVDDAYGQADWTSLFFDDFRRLRDYDLREKLHYLYARGETEISRRVLSDYRETISDLLLSEFTEKWDQWAVSKGTLTRNQAHGSPANILDLYAASGIPETEGNDLLGIKMASSAANISGKRLTSSETATWLNEHFMASLGDVKNAVDLFFLGGVNHIVYHGTTYSPQEEVWPGWMFYASVHFGPSNPFWKDFHILNNYVSRCQSFLQNSDPDNDILVYFPFYDLLAQPGNEMLHHIGSHISLLPLPGFLSAAQHLADKGYAFDYISDRQLKKLQYKNGMINSGSSNYKVIVIPESNIMPLESLESIMKLAGQGAQVVVQNQFPQDVPGFYKFKRRQEKLLQIRDSLQFSDIENFGIQRAPAGKGMVYIGSDLHKILIQARVRSESLAAKGLQFIRRNHKNGTMYFIKNSTNDAFDDWVMLSSDFVSAAVFNPMDNTFGRAGIRETEDSNREVFLQLQPGAAVFVQTFGNTLNADPYPYWTAAGDQQTVQGSWSIQFSEGGPVLPEDLAVSNLDSWTNLGDENTKAFSGSAVYTIDLDLDINDQHDWLLDLGQVHESAVVELNGKHIASMISSPFRCIIPAELIGENNQLHVTVTNLMANRMAHLDRQSADWKKFYNINFPARLAENRGNDGLFTARNWKPVESGLTGPVTLTPVRKFEF